MASQLKMQSFSVVQLGQDPGSGSTFPPNLMPALNAGYRVDRTGPTRVFYVPSVPAKARCARWRPASWIREA